MDKSIVNMLTQPKGDEAHFATILENSASRMRCSKNQASVTGMTLPPFPPSRPELTEEQCIAIARRICQETLDLMIDKFNQYADHKIDTEHQYSYVQEYLEPMISFIRTFYRVHQGETFYTRDSMCLLSIVIDVAEDEESDMRYFRFRSTAVQHTTGRKDIFREMQVIFYERE